MFSAQNFAKAVLLLSVVVIIVVVFTGCCGDPGLEKTAAEQTTTNQDFNPDQGF